MKKLLLFSLIMGLSSATSARASLEAQLRSVIIPNVALQEAGLRESLEFLRQSARSQTSNAFSPNLVLLISPEEEARRKVTLTLQEIPLYDALQYVARLTSLQMRVEDRAVLFTLPTLSAEPLPED